MYQIIGLRYNPRKSKVQHKYYQHYASDYVNLVRAKPNLVKLIKETEGPEEAYNLFYTASIATPNDRMDFKSQEIIPFDIDKIDLNYMEDYLDVWTGVIGISYRKCWVVATGNGLQVMVRVKPFDAAYIVTHKLAYTALCKALESAFASVDLPGKMDTTVWCKTQLLRLPGTWNRKPFEKPFAEDANVKQAKVFCKGVEIHQFNWDKWTLEAPKKSKPKQSYAFKPHDIEYIFKNCDFLAKQLLEGGASSDYPQWYATLGVTSWLQVESGKYVESFNHLVSNKFHKYDSQDVDDKVQECLKSTGPRTCDSIDSIWDGCKTCKKYSQRHKFATPINLRPFSQQASDEAIAEFERMEAAAGFTNLAIPLQERGEENGTRLQMEGRNTGAETSSGDLGESTGNIAGAAGILPRGTEEERGVGNRSSENSETILRRKQEEQISEGRASENYSLNETGIEDVEILEDCTDTIVTQVEEEIITEEEMGSYGRNSRNNNGFSSKSEELKRSGNKFAKNTRVPEHEDRGVESGFGEHKENQGQLPDQASSLEGSLRDIGRERVGSTHVNSDMGKDNENLHTIGEKNDNDTSRATPSDSKGFGGEDTGSGGSSGACNGDLREHLISEGQGDSGARGSFRGAESPLGGIEGEVGREGQEDSGTGENIIPLDSEGIEIRGGESGESSGEFLQRVFGGEVKTVGHGDERKAVSLQLSGPGIEARDSREVLAGVRGESGESGESSNKITGSSQQLSDKNNYGRKESGEYGRNSSEERESDQQTVGGSLRQEDNIGGIPRRSGDDTGGDLEDCSTEIGESLQRKDDTDRNTGDNNTRIDGGRSEHRAQDDLGFAKKSGETGESGGSEFGDSNICRGGQTRSQDGRSDKGNEQHAVEGQEDTGGASLSKEDATASNTDKTLNIGENNESKDTLAKANQTTGAECRGSNREIGGPEEAIEEACSIQGSSSGVREDGDRSQAVADAFKEVALSTDWQSFVDTGFAKHVKTGKIDDKGNEIYKFVGRENLKLVGYFHHVHGYVYLTDTDRTMVYADGFFTKWEDVRVKAFAQKYLKHPLPEKDDDLKQFLWKTKVIAEYHDQSAPFVDPKNTEDLINCKNGVLNIRTRELTSHDPKYRFLYRLDYDYEPGATCPTWDLLLQNIMVGRQHLVDLIEEYLGFAITGCKYDPNAFLVFLGRGSNGKTTLLNCLDMLFGSDNISGVKASGIQRTFESSLLEGKLLNVGEEETKESFKDSETLKALTGHSKIKIERKFEAPYFYKNRAKLILTFNEDPKIEDKTDGFKRRTHIIPFDMSVEKDPSKRIAKIDEKLAKELPGILNRLLEAFARFEKRGRQFINPPESKALYRKLLVDSDEVWEWAEDELEVTKDVGDKLHTSELYENFKGCAPYSRLTKSGFGKKLYAYLQQKGLENKKVRIGDKVLKGYSCIRFVDGSGTSQDLQK